MTPISITPPSRTLGGVDIFLEHETGLAGASRAKLGSSDLYEYLVDNFWFKASNLERETINEPLRGDHKANIVIIGGGYLVFQGVRPT